eukprot:TRINITY_DN16436_c0_g1_i1.p1 TRINITY_DN16436_c0_g1~~TRINITY_DN16436_c0_g1_i1.p1  ORF type:complete len:326 (+),score=52.04 TRINITY_DN16436_c0_g1_i1:47-1024(+)
MDVAATPTSTVFSGPACPICMGALGAGKQLDPCEHTICIPCFDKWAETCRCPIPGVPPACGHCETGKVECPLCRTETTHPADSKNDQRRRKIERDQRHALRRAREQAEREQRLVKKKFKVRRTVGGTIGIRFRGREITEVVESTPAFDCGLRAGMRVYSIDNKKVEDHSDEIFDALCIAPLNFYMICSVPESAGERPAREAAQPAAPAPAPAPAFQAQERRAAGAYLDQAALQRHNLRHENRGNNDIRNNIPPPPRAERERLPEHRDILRDCYDRHQALRREGLNHYMYRNQPGPRANDFQRQNLPWNAPPVPCMYRHGGRVGMP